LLQVRRVELDVLHPVKITLCRKGIHI